MVQGKMVHVDVFQVDVVQVVVLEIVLFLLQYVGDQDQLFACQVHVRS